MWNRLLLLAYPKGPRRDEVLDTLAMAAEAGGARPRAVNLVRHGLRARLGHPRSRTVVVLSLLLAFAGGFVAASATNRLAWQAGPGLPDEAAAGRIAELIAPGVELEAQGDQPFGYPPGEQLTARRLYDRMPGTPETRQVTAYMAGLRARLAAAGWEIVDQGTMNAHDATLGREVGDRQFLSARRDGLILSVGDNYHPEQGDDFLIVSVNAAEPAWISAVTLAAGLLGAAVTWLVVGWASRRSDGRASASVLAGAAAWIGLPLLWPPVHGARGYLPELARGGYDPAYPFWTDLTMANYGPFAVLAGLLFATALGISALGRRPAVPSPVR